MLTSLFDCCTAISKFQCMLSSKNKSNYKTARILSPGFNNISWPGVKFCPRGEMAPSGELCPLGGFTPLFTPRAEHSLMFRGMKVRTEGFHPWGITSPLGDKVHPWGPTSPLGANFTPGGQLHPWG
jgi:hypothetical protein